jgi:uncharacterized membrane protein (UPF0127 family)
MACQWPSQPHPGPTSVRIRANVAAILIGLLVAPMIRVEAGPDRVPESVVVITTPQGVKVQAELADTTQKRAMGLMFRESLPANHGMLFTFLEEQEWSFWMKNTRMPLDIIWINKGKKIVHIERNVPVVPITSPTNQPCTYSKWPPARPTS